jgi:hypothetical protein
VYSGGPEAYGSASVTVTGDVAGIIVAMSPAPEMTGTISLAERGGQVNLRGVRVTLNDLPFEEMPQQGRSDASGKFTFGKPIRPGHYSMNVDPQTIPAGCFVREVKLGGQEVSSIDFEIQISRLFEIVSGLMLEGAWIDEA